MIKSINKFNLKNKNALITGAARLSGIKHSYALLENHCDLVLTDINFDNLLKLKEKLSVNYPN